MTIEFSDDLRVVVKTVYDGVSVVMNVYHYEAGVGVDATEAAVTAALLTHIDNAYDQLRDILNEKMVGDTLEVLKRDPVTNKWTTVGAADFSGWSGDNAGDEEATGVAAVVRFFSIGTGRQSRKFLGVLADNQIVDGVLIAGAVVDLEAYANIIDNPVAVTGGNLDPTWWSEKYTEMLDIDGGYAVNTIPGYQRRRKVGVGI